MNKKAIGILFQISVVLIAMLSSMAAADSPPVKLPMILSGTVIDKDTGEAAVEGTSVIAKDSSTSTVVAETLVGPDGKYGDGVNNKLLVNECSFFDVYILIGGEEVKVDSLTWEEGAIKTDSDIEYMKVTESSADSGNSGSSSSNYKAYFTSSSESDTGIAGGAGLEAATDSNQEVAATSSVLSTNEDESSLPGGLMVVALVGIIGIIVFLAYKKLQ